MFINSCHKTNQYDTTKKMSWKQSIVKSRDPMRYQGRDNE